MAHAVASRCTNKGHRRRLPTKTASWTDRCTATSQPAHSSLLSPLFFSSHRSTRHLLFFLVRPTIRFRIPNSDNSTLCIKRRGCFLLSPNITSANWANPVFDYLRRRPYQLTPQRCASNNCCSAQLHFSEWVEIAACVNLIDKALKLGPARFKCLNQALSDRIIVRHIASNQLLRFLVQSTCLVELHNIFGDQVSASLFGVILSIAAVRTYIVPRFVFSHRLSSCFTKTNTAGSAI